MRITINEKIYNKIIEIFKNDEEVIKELEIAKAKNEESNKSIKKVNAIYKARRFKEEDTFKKIKNAINLLTLESQKITISTVAKRAEVHYATAKKYFKILNLE